MQKSNPSSEKMNIGTIEIPVGAATKSFAILAKRGAGKTYTAAVLAEEFAAHNVPFVVFDPIDVWWGLRFGADGKSKGLPVVVFGLDHADIKLDKDMGRKIAQMVVKHNVSCVISTFGMPKNQQRHLIAEFAEELLNINKGRRHVFIEEAHEFVPQRVSGAMGKTFSAVEALMVMGRNRGIGVTLVNQRAATINKDVLTQVDTLIALRNVAPQDRKALKEWVEVHSAEEDFDEFWKSLPSLPNGVAWVWSPEFLECFKQIKIRKRKTYHPDREKAGDVEMPELKSADVESFVSEFSKKKEVQAYGGGFQSAEKDPKFDRRVISFRHKIPEGSEGCVTMAGPSVKMYTEKEVQVEIRKALRDKEETNKKLRIIITKMLDLMEKAKRHLNTSFVDIEMLNNQPLVSIAFGVGGVKPKNENDGVNGHTGERIMTVDTGEEKKLTGGALRMLKVLVSRYPMKMTRSQLATFAKLKPTSGTYGTYLSTLKTGGYIEEDSDVLMATERGIEYIGESPDAPQTRDELISMWKNVLNGGAQRMFMWLVNEYPDWTDRQTLAISVGLDPESGTYGTYLSMLRTNGLIEEQDNLMRLSSTFNI